MSQKIHVFGMLDIFVLQQKNNIMKKISLGCGRQKKEGIIGLDWQNFGWNIIWKAGDPLPQEVQECDEIEAYNFIEHIDRPTAWHVLNECWHALKKGGIMKIITPNASKSLDLALQDPEHLSMWVKGTFTQYISGNRPRNYQGVCLPWNILKCEDYEKESRDMYIEMTPKK